MAVLDRGEPRQLRRLSRALGRNDAYLHQFLYRGSPRHLPEELRHQLAGLLGVEEAVLRPETVALGDAGPAPARFSVRPDGPGPRIVHIPLLEVEASEGKWTVRLYGRGYRYRLAVRPYHAGRVI